MSPSASRYSSIKTTILLQNQTSCDTSADQIHQSGNEEQASGSVEAATVKDTGGDDKPSEQKPTVISLILAAFESRLC